MLNAFVYFGFLGKVKFERSKNDSKDWFNIFVIHQNRDKGRGVKNCVHESMIPEWIDLVLWGHEHKSEIDPVESAQGKYSHSEREQCIAYMEAL